jgi:hypothetical protein
MLKRWKRSVNHSSDKMWLYCLLFVVLILVMIIGAGCGPDQNAAYDPAAYDNDVGLKNRAIELMKHAVNEYSELQITVLQEFSALQSEMEALKGSSVPQNPSPNQPGLQGEIVNAYRADREKLKNDLTKALETEKLRPKNELTVKMWETLSDPNRDLLGGFLDKWGKDTALLEDYLQMKQNLGDRKVIGNLELMAGALKKWLEGRSLTAAKIEELMGQEDNPAAGTIIWAFKQLIKWEEYKKPECKKEREALLNELQQWVEAKKL